MRRNFLLLLMFGVIGSAQAQYFQINHLNGTVAINGVNVTVTQSSPAPNTGNLCNTGPYQIGKNYSDSYTYTFGTPVTHFRIKAIRFHDDDTMKVLVNGVPYDFSAGGTAYNGNATCNLTTNNMIYTTNGLVSTTGGATGPGQGVQLDIVAPPPGQLNSVQVIHARSAGNLLASDIIYSAEYQDDICELPVTASVQSTPICAGNDIQLSATLYPNTTYSWVAVPPTVSPTFAPSANVREPLLKSVVVPNTGTYRVTGVRGTCIYTATVDVPITLPPKVGKAIQTGPECPGADDTIKVPNINISTGGQVYAWGPTGLQVFDPRGYFLEFKNVQINNRGLYYVYAVDAQGCISDTSIVNFRVLGGVVAGFNYTVKEGCENDEVIFNSISVDNNVQYWSFGDGSPIATDKDPTHLYTVPKPNNAARNYTVRLIAANGNCADTAMKNIELNHPIVAEFNIDDDSICQGDVVTFNNTSGVKPGTIPTFMWNLGYGDDKKIQSLTHTNQYNNEGLYTASLKVIDYLGCEEEYELDIRVDSVGGIEFVTNKESVCQGDEVIFTGDYYDVGANSVTWDFSDGVTANRTKKELHSFLETGKYNVTYAIDYRICPDITVNKEIEVRPYPNIYLGEDTAICPDGNPVYIGDIANPNNASGIKYKWNTVTKDVTGGVYVRSPGVYAVTAELDGCIATDSIIVKKSCYIDIPNVFTPNGDGKNDYFLPRQLLSRNVTEFDMQVYNRWGQLIYATNTANGRGWDGTFKGSEQPTGVYVYNILVNFGNGTNERYQGNVTLLR